MAALAPAFSPVALSCKNVGAVKLVSKASTRSRVAVVASAGGKDAPRVGSKAPAKETLLTPRFYTTDFDEMEAVRHPML